jgi:Fe-S-cluster containining protein
VFSISKTLTGKQLEFDPADLSRWEARTLAVTRQLDATKIEQLVEKAVRAPSPAAKVFYLREMSDALGKAAAPALPCKSGCSDCCHMPVVISEVEAIQIAKSTGAKMRKSGISYSAVGKSSLSATACSFLEAGKCSIYQNRPYACRVYFVVHEDNSRCKITPGVTLVAPQINVDSYHRAYVRALGEGVVDRMADVREFFPHGLKRR